MPDASVTARFGSESVAALRSTVTTEDLQLSSAGDYESYEVTVRVVDGAFQTAPKPQDPITLSWQDNGSTQQRVYTILTAIPDPTTGMIRMDLGNRGAALDI